MLGVIDGLLDLLLERGVAVGLPLFGGLVISHVLERQLGRFVSAVALVDERLDLGPTDVVEVLVLVGVLCQLAVGIDLAVQDLPRVERGVYVVAPVGVAVLRHGDDVALALAHGELVVVAEGEAVVAAVFVAGRDAAHQGAVFGGLGIVVEQVDVVGHGRIGHDRDARDGVEDAVVASGELVGGAPLVAAREIVGACLGEVVVLVGRRVFVRGGLEVKGLEALDAAVVVRDPEVAGVVAVFVGEAPAAVVGEFLGLGAPAVLHEPGPVALGLVV